MSKQNDKIIELLEKIVQGVEKLEYPKYVYTPTQEIADQNNKPKKKLRPEIGEVYFYIEDLDICEIIWGISSNADSGLWDSGNAFFTKEEAEKELAKRKAKQKIKDYIIENGLEFEPDWQSEGQIKWAIFYNSSKERLSTDCGLSYRLPDTAYFDSREHAEQVIKDCKDSLLILFDVKE